MVNILETLLDTLEDRFINEIPRDKDITLATINRLQGQQEVITYINEYLYLLNNGGKK